MNKPAITPQFIAYNMQLLMQYLLLKEAALPKIILTGSASLHYIGQLSRQPNDVDIILQCSVDDMAKVEVIVTEYGRMTGDIAKKWGYLTADSMMFVAIEIKNVKFDIWITCHKIPTLEVSLPNSSIHLATPEYTWKRKLECSNPESNDNHKECQAKGLADIHESLDLFRARELKLLTYIMAKPPQVQIVVHSPMHTNLRK